MSRLASETGDLFEIAEDSADMLQPFARPCDHDGTLSCTDKSGPSKAALIMAMFHERLDQPLDPGLGNSRRDNSRKDPKAH